MKTVRKPQNVRRTQGTTSAPHVALSKKQQEKMRERIRWGIAALGVMALGISVFRPSSVLLFLCLVIFWVFVATYFGLRHTKPKRRKSRGRRRK